MEQSEFEQLVNEGVAQVPEKFLMLLKNVAIVIEDEPGAEQLKKLKLRKDSLLFGLYEGVPLTKRGAYYSSLPDKITIFKNQIEQDAGSAEEVKEIVKNTVWHELGHYFGSDEESIRKAEKRRGRRR